MFCPCACCSFRTLIQKILGRIFIDFWRDRTCDRQKNWFWWRSGSRCGYGNYLQEFLPLTDRAMLRLLLITPKKSTRNYYENSFEQWNVSRATHRLWCWPGSRSWSGNFYGKFCRYWMRSKRKNLAESADFGGGLRSPSDSSSRSLCFFFSKCPTTPLNGVSGRVLLPDQIDPGRDQVAGQNFSPDSNS